MKKKKFKLFDAILATVCITLVADSVAPTASIGNSQFFWWIFLLIAFCLPYGLISAELGSTYPSDGGMYEWVKKAFGKKMAARVAWNYWINFPLWIASLATAITDVIMGIFSIELSLVWLLVIQLGYTWIVSLLGCLRIGESKWIVNIGTIFKVLFMVGLGLLGIYVAATYGLANEYTIASLFPSLDLAGIGFVSVIIFNFLGFEVVSTFAEDLKNPKKEIPKAIIIGGILMAVFYLLPSFGINVAIPVEEIPTTTGITESFAIMMGIIGVPEQITSTVIIVIGLMFIYTMVANIVSWSFGVNSVAKYSAEDGGLPKVFAKVNKEKVPYMGSIINGIVASVIIVIGLLIPESGADLFWTFFSFSLVTLLISYLPLFPAFLKLRKIDPNVTRPYKVEGGEFKLKLMTYVPVILLVLGIFFTLFPDFTIETLTYQWPLIVGVIVSIIIQELLVLFVKEDTKKNAKTRK
ncbi:MAG: APC family permease [Bacilli bacterium]|nr:APC family permease [Bacilli bacterium]